MFAEHHANDNADDHADLIKVFKDEIVPLAEKSLAQAIEGLEKIRQAVEIMKLGTTRVLSHGEQVAMACRFRDAHWLLDSVNNLLAISGIGVLEHIVHHCPLGRDLIEGLGLNEEQVRSAPAELAISRARMGLEQATTFVVERIGNPKKKRRDR
jgi:hypothetical protein